MSISFSHTYTELPDRFYSAQAPSQVPAPELLQLNEELCDELGIDLDWIRSEQGLGMLSGNELPESAHPISQAYAGHQFGNFVPQLGDGRAILLGEIDGKDLQLKGAGRTPYSRGGDGKSALGPVLREYLVSEAMYALGVPTTRALAAVATGEAVHRQEGPVPGGIFTRVAASHIRVGTFQYFLVREDQEALQELTQYAIKRHYPDAESIIDFFKAVVSRQATLIAQWMSLGFIHGVMNTDNCSISGETIDFGPCAFMDEFDPKKVFSSIDRNSRYSWENQARIAHWNLTRLAECLLPLLAETPQDAIPLVEEALEAFAPQFEDKYLLCFREKLGLRTASESFINQTLSLLADHRLDFTLFFRNLTRVAMGEDSDFFAGHEKWLSEWKSYGPADASLMQSKNPIIIPRNHRIEEAITAAYNGDFSYFHRLVKAFKTPFQEQAEFADLETPPREHEKVRETFCGT